MRIEDCIWLTEIVEKLAQKHAVDQIEVEGFLVIVLIFALFPKVVVGVMRMSMALTGKPMRVDI